MTDYTKTTDFTSKDSLPSGDSGKIIRGAEFGTEFDNIETAVNSKSNINNPAFTGNITVTGTVDGRDIATDGTKLDTIETSADVTDTANVTAAGALMDSEVTNLAQVKAFDSADYATAAQGTTADNALPKTGGAMTGAITTNSTFDGRDVATDGTKLDGIEVSADVTDTANVTAAGALMDSELTSEASVKALNQGVATTDSPTFAGVTANGTVEFDGLSGTGAVTVTDILDQDNMSGNSATALATQQSIKAYVDSQVGTVDTLAEVLANGNATGGTDIAFGDNDKATFGASDDLEIYHDGSHSYIKDNGTGNLRLQGATTVQITDPSFTSYSAQFNPTGAVTLYHDNTARLATASTGVDVTGTVTADGGTIVSTGSDAFSSKAVGGYAIQAYQDATSSGHTALDLRSDATTGTRYLIRGYKDAAGTPTEVFSVGADGTATMDGLTVSAAAATANITSTSGGATLNLTHPTATSGYSIRQGNADANDFRIFEGSKIKLNINTGGDISFYEDTGTTPKLFWDASAESLGLGTSTPSASYSIDAVKGIRSSGAAPNFTLQETDTGNQTWLMASYGGSFAIRDTTVSGTSYPFKIEAATPNNTLYLNSAGNAGIGTSNPASNLHLTGAATGLTIEGTTRGDLFLIDSGAATDQKRKTIRSFDGDLIFGTENDAISAFTEAMRIDSSGNVGIGTSPKSGWVTNAVQLGTNLSLSEDANSAYLSANAYNSSTGWKRVNNQLAGYIRMGTNDGIFSFSNAVTGAADSAISWQERMRINSSGNVGIGTSSPDTHLHVQGSSGEIRVQDTGSGGGIVSFRDSGTSSIPSIRSSGNNLLVNTGGSEAMRIDALGNLLVGCTLAGASNGVTLHSSGYIQPRTNTGIPAIYADREGSDGSIIELRKDGTAVGSLQTFGGNLQISPATSFGVDAPTDIFLDSAGVTTFKTNGTENARIDADGLKFNGDTAAANALDDYEEGTFTLTISSASFTISSQTNTYTKIGNTVSIRGRITFSAVLTNGSSVVFTGAPFTCTNSMHGVGVARETTTSGDIFTAQLSAGTATFALTSMDGIAVGSNQVLLANKNYDYQITYQV